MKAAIGRFLCQDQKLRHINIDIDDTGGTLAAWPVFIVGNKLKVYFSQMKTVISCLYETGTSVNADDLVSVIVLILHLQQHAPFKTGWPALGRHYSIVSFGRSQSIQVVSFNFLHIANRYTQSFRLTDLSLHTITDFRAAYPNIRTVPQDFDTQYHTQCTLTRILVIQNLRIEQGAATGVQPCSIAMRQKRIA